MQKYFITKKILVFVFLLSTTLIHAQFHLTKLQTEYQETPLGIDVKKPVFSWLMKADTNLRGLSQKAYQIKVIDESGSTVWDSKKVASGTSIGIPYNGAELKPT